MQPAGNRPRRFRAGGTDVRARPLDQETEKVRRMIKQRNIFVTRGLSPHFWQRANHPLADRIGDFRERADEARRDAARACSSEARLDHERLAKSWEELISEILAVIDASKNSRDPRGKGGGI